VQAPVLLIVGEEDRDVIALNEGARAWISSATKLLTIPGAGHLFEEPGTLDRALTLAGDWFRQHMQGGAFDRAAVR
jgi:putative phosphoribosyl transferase